MKYPSLALAAVALLAVTPTPPPPPPALNAAPAPSASALPTASPTPATSSSNSQDDLDKLFAPGARPLPAAKGGATPAPPSSRRVGLDGVWEIQIQRGANVQYEHFKLMQTGTTLRGIYLTRSNKRYPVAGSLDGRNIRLVVSLANGSTILFEGRVDGTTDMLGMMTDSKEQVPFTAAYRAKQKFFDNINPDPGLGGLSNAGSSLPPR